MTVARDAFGRRIDYLRISVIDECNLRCVYCMAPDDHGTIAPPDLLTAAEIGVVARAAQALGFRKVRLTGGEPTLRADLPAIVAAIAAAGIPDIALTTNGVRLPGLARVLADAGLTRVNIHVDTLHPGRLPAVMRGARLEGLLAGIDAAERAGFFPIKLNSVVARGYNDTDVVALAALTLEHPWHVRFIETMPLGRGTPARIARECHVPTAETAGRIERALGPLRPLANVDPSDEARCYRLGDAPGVVGFISPVSAPYCGTCNRMRLTADGRFHLCLLNDGQVDVRPVLRGGGRSDDVLGLLVRAIADKPVGHRLQIDGTSTGRDMFELGG